LSDNEYAIIITTCAGKDEARTLAKFLLGKRLAACVQLFPAESIYLWQDKLCRDEETVLFIKSRSALFEQVKTAIRENHSYEVPEIIRVPINAGLPEYLRWIGDCTGDSDAVKISKAWLEDMEAVLRLQNAAYQSEAELHGDFTIQPLMQALEALIAEYHISIVLKAVLGGEIIGSVRARAEGETAYIGKLMVHPGHQGKGLGKRLLAAIEQEFPGRRCELFTSCKSERNLHLYEAAGYARFREETDQAGIRFAYFEKKGR